MTAAPAGGVTRLHPLWWVAAGMSVVGAVVVALAVGAVAIRPTGVALELLDAVPAVAVDSGLSDRDSSILWQLRLPRVVLALLVGSMLAACGAAYQGVFRNPLADPYLLGSAAGAGLGVTVAVVVSSGAPATTPPYLPLAAFVGALAAVGLSFAVATSAGARALPGALILAGVAVASFLTAVQTYLQQQHQETIRQVYSWILGRLSTAGWSEVRTALPYAAVTTVVLLSQRRALDVLALGDDEASSLGVNPTRVRLLVVAAATLGTAAAVSVSGLIGFVGLIVPHGIRLLAGAQYRSLLPLSLLFGAAFLTLADVVARVSLAPAEIPIGVVTAFFGAPFFVLILRTGRRHLR